MAAHGSWNRRDVAIAVGKQFSKIGDRCSELARLEYRHAPLRDHHCALPHAAAAGSVELSTEQNLTRPLRIGRIDNYDVEAAIGLGDVCHAVRDHEIEALVGQ